MALDLSGKDPKDLTRDEILYLQDRDRLPAGVDPIPQSERTEANTVQVAHATGSVTVPESELDKWTGRDNDDDAGEVVEVNSYDELSTEDLKAELAERKLPTTGKKDELVKRLEADDAKSQG